MLSNSKKRRKAQRGPGSKVKLSAFEKNRNVEGICRKNGKPLPFRSQRNRLDCVKSFLRWLRKVKAIEADPMVEFEMPRQEKHLPKAILSEPETMAGLETPDVSTIQGLRDNKGRFWRLE